MELKFEMKNPEKMALLTHGFNDYTTTGKTVDLKQKIQAHVNNHGDEDPPKMPFFQEYHNKKTNKRSSQGTTGLTPPPKEQQHEVNQEEVTFRA